MSGAIGGTIGSRRRELEGTVASVQGQVLMGNLIDSTNQVASNVFATKANGFPKNCSNCTWSVAIIDSDDCYEGHDNAAKFKLQVPTTTTFSTDVHGNVGDEGTGGWLLQSLREMEDTDPALSISLTELVNGTNSEYHSAVYFYDPSGDLLACASLKKNDEATAAIYNDLLNDLNGVAKNADTDSATAVEKDTSSGSKSNMSVAMSAIAAVGITVVLGDTFAF